MLLVALAHADDAPASFEARVQAEIERLSPFLATVPERVMAGAGAAADAELAERARAAGTPEALYVAGNLLWARDPEAAYELHRRAWELVPEESVVSLEWGMELHRAGRCDEAIPRYRQHLADRAGDAAGWALAHCLVVTGDVDAAAEALERAAPATTHVAGESVLADLFEPADPWKVRERLLAEARAGGADAWLALLDWDTAFPLDPWNVAPDDASLALDLPAAELALAADPVALADVRAFVAVRTGSAPTADLAGLHAERVPSSYPLAEAILGARLQAEEPELVWKSVHKDLAKRARAGDDAALTLLAAVTYEGKPERLPALDAVGCARGLVVFCTSALVSERPSALADVLRRLPHDSRIEAAALLGQPVPDPDLLRDWLVDAPRLVPDGPAWHAGLVVLRQRRAEQPIDPAALAVLHAGLTASLARPTPACAPWEGPERLASPLCERH